MGYLISNCDIKFKYRIIRYILAIVGLLLHILGTYSLSVKEGQLVQIYKGYINIPCVLYSLGVFIFIKYAALRLKDCIIPFIEKISENTFGVYLIHIFLIRGSEMVFHIDNTNLLYRLLAPIVYFSISIGLIMLLKKIPLLKLIVP